MSEIRTLRLGTTKVLLLAVVLAFLFAIPTFMRAETPTASAQINCGTYTSYSGSCNGIGTTGCGIYGCTNNCGTVYGCSNACGTIYGCSNGCGTTYAYGCNSACGTTYAYGCSTGCGTTSAYGCTSGCGTTYAYGCSNTCGTVYASGCANGCGTTYAYGCTNGCGTTYAYGCNSGCANGFSCNSCGIVSYACNSSCSTGVYAATAGCGGCVGGYSLACPGGSAYSNSCSAYAGGVCPTTGACSAYAGGVCPNGSPYAYGAAGSCASINLASYPIGSTCSNGVVSCGTTNTPVSVGGSCNGVGAAGTGACTQYSSTTGQCMSYAAATTAASTTCTQYSSTTGQCVSYAPATTAATQACTQYSSTTGQCIQYSASTTAASAAGTNNCPAGQFVTASGCSASTVQQTCPGSGITVTPAPGQSLTSACPVVCYTSGGLPQLNGPGTTCPQGTTTTAPAGAASTSASSSSTASTNLSAPAASTAGGVTVTMNAGWNIAAGPPGTTLTGAGPTIFTLQAADNGNYESLPSSSQLTSGQGYWAQFSAATTVNLPSVGSGSATVQLPAGQAVMIGNGGNSVATVTGMDSLVIWDPVQQTWTQTTTLKAGQGGFATSNAGGQATITWGSTAPASGSTPADSSS